MGNMGNMNWANCTRCNLHLVAHIEHMELMTYMNNQLYIYLYIQHFCENYQVLPVCTSCAIESGNTLRIFSSNMSIFQSPSLIVIYIIVCSNCMVLLSILIVIHCDCQHFPYLRSLAAWITPWRVPNWESSPRVKSWDQD